MLGEMAWISVEWDKLASGFPPEIYAQTLNAATFGEESAPPEMKWFWAWFSARFLTRRLQWLGRDHFVFRSLAFVEFQIYSAILHRRQETMPRYLLTAGRSLARTENGHLVLLPGTATKGDAIALVSG